jgi:hypothetical protein
MDKIKQFIYFIPILLLLLFFLPECSVLGKLAAGVNINSADQIQDPNTYKWTIYIFYTIQNTGEREFDYYSVLFMIRDEDGIEYREWDYGYYVDVGKSVNDSISIEINEKKAEAIVVDDVILDFPHSYGE